jgi:hypothetical protein
LNEGGGIRSARKKEKGERRREKGGGRRVKRRKGRRKEEEGKPASSYSSLLIHSCWKVEREPKIEAPIQTLYFLSGGAITLTFMVDGARLTTSFWILSAIPGNMVEPPIRVRRREEGGGWKEGEGREG